MAPGNTFAGLRALRRAADITQSELAKAIGVRGAATISDWERGAPVKRISLETIDALCDVLSKALRRKITLDDLRRTPK